MLVVSYLVRVTGGVPRAGEEVDEVRYHTAAELPRYLAASIRDMTADVGARD